jgi:hypothetical protein
MTTFPRSPRLVKGAIVAVDPFRPPPTVIAFQYNPKIMTRSLKSQIGSAGGSRTEVLRLKGPPKETINIDVMINAANQLERSDPVTSILGIYPQLSALEMLIYPKSLQVITNTILATLGTIEVIPPEAPMTLLIWGLKRVVPVNLTSFTITEQEFDTRLNPIRAKVALSMEVLTYDDLPMANPGYYVFLAHQVAKEVMSSMSSAGRLGGVISGGLL